MTIYLIGGTPRVGKSTLYRSFRKIFDGDCVELDALKPHWHYWEPAQEEIMLKEPDKTRASEAWLEAIRKRDYAIWQETKDWLRHFQDMTLGSMVVNGNLWADYISDLKAMDIPHYAVFVGDTRPEHVEHVIAIAKAGEKLSNNWQAGWPEEKLRDWAKFNLERSREHRRLSEHYGYPFFDVADLGSLQAVTDAAYAHLSNTL